MLLRRIIEHTNAQNWTAIMIDFVIVVVGVFIGIQVANWNEQLAFERREQVLTQELRGEVVQNMADVQAKGESFLVGAAAARRILERIERGNTRCADDCWSIVVDLMHASQWQQINSRWPTYDELRRDGLPSNRRIIELVEEYKKVNSQVALVLAGEPRYRGLVRSLIPIEWQDQYWQNCFGLESGNEYYLYPCPVPKGLRTDSERLDEILLHSDLAPSLREWTSIAQVVAKGLTGGFDLLGEEILMQIDVELGVLH
jgi:hypothetical protein